MAATVKTAIKTSSKRDSSVFISLIRMNGFFMVFYDGTQTIWRTCESWQIYKSARPAFPSFDPIRIKSPTITSISGCKRHCDRLLFYRRRHGVAFSQHGGEPCPKMGGIRQGAHHFIADRDRLISLTSKPQIVCEGHKIKRHAFCSNCDVTMKGESLFIMICSSKNARQAKHPK